MPRFLLIKLSSIGDIAHALPVARALRSRVPDATIDWLVQPEYIPLLEHCPDIDNLIPFPRRHFLRGLPALVRALRAAPYDAILDLQGLLKSALPARIARRTAPSKPIYGPAWSREGASRFYTITPVRAPLPRRHAVDELLDIAALVAPPAPGEPFPRPRLDVEPAPVSEDASGPRIAFAPFSRWTTKNWPSDAFAAVGRRLASEMGARIFILGSAADAPLAAPLAAQVPNARLLCGNLGFPALLSFLKSLDLFVSVDSGPLHWADAMGVPVVAIYGSTDPVRTGPYYSQDHVVTHPTLSCRPCHARTCARSDLACLRDLAPDLVFAACMAQL